MLPVVSVIIPTYNRVDKLKKTIESVLAQTFSDFELLICDDGSTDDTVTMVRQFADERIRWLSGSNSGGPATPRNRGIKDARGTWLAFLDSDDLWYTDKLEKQIALLTQNEKLKAVCSNANVLVNEELLTSPYFKDEPSKLLTFDDMLKVNGVICSSMLLHKSLAIQMGGFPEAHSFKAIEDYALWLSISMLTDIYYLKEPLLIYRDEPKESIRGENSQSEQQIKKKILAECLVRVKLLTAHKLNYRCKIILCYLRHYLKYIKNKFIRST